MAAMGADGEYFAATAHQQHLVVADVSQKLVVDEFGEADAFCQIRAAWWLSVRWPCSSVGAIG